VGNTALDGRLLGAADEPSRRARLRRALGRAAQPPWKVWREARSASIHEWETNRSLADLPDATAGPLKRHAEALMPTVLPIRVLDGYVQPLIAASVVAGIAVGLVVPQAWLDDPARAGGWLRVAAIWLPLFVVAGGMTLLQFTAPLKRVLSDRAHLLIVATLACVWTAIVIGFDHWHGLGDEVRYGVSAAALSAATLSAGLVLLIAVYVLLAYVLRRIAIARHADSVFVRSLLDAVTNLFFLDGREHEGLGFDPRREAVTSLEAAAVAAEHYLPRFLDPRDEATGKWLQERAAQWASALRANKRWILTERTRDEHAVDRLRETLRAAATGNWNELERRPAFQASRGSRLRVLAATALRAATPLAATIVVRAFGVPGFDGPIGDYVLIGSGVWLALSFLAQYDPLFSAKIGAAADISKTLRG
jgi:hypothetical protein